MREEDDIFINDRWASEIVGNAGKEMMQGNSTQDLLSRMTHSRKERLELFRSIPPSQKGFIFLRLSKHVQRRLLSSLSDHEIVDFLNALGPDEVTDIVQCLPKKSQDRVLRDLEASIREKVEFLLKFNPKSAAGIMSLDYVQVDVGDTFRKVSSAIKRHERRTGKFPTIIVLKEGAIQGELLGHSLALHGPDEHILPFIRRIPNIHFDKDKAEVIRTFRNNPHDKIVVIDEGSRVLGIIFSDDILRTMHMQSGKSLYDFAGVSDEESVNDPVASKVKHRYKWLIVNLATAFLASSIVALFQDTIQAFVLLAVYMPIIAGMGGNTGTQTLAVVVRGIALKEVDARSGRKVVIKEMFSGLINGVIIGVIVAFIAAVFNNNLLFGLITGVAMVATLLIAGLFGAVIPLVMKKLGNDPATSAAIFITTATDLFGFFTFLGLATLMLGSL